MNFAIGKHEIGRGCRVFVVAEMSANHLQDYDLAKRTVLAAKEAGADAIKLQTYTPDTITTDSDNEIFRIRSGSPWDGMTLYELYEQAYMPWDWHPKLKVIAEDVGLGCFSSAFDKTAVDFLEDCGVPAHKIASFEITDIPLIEYIASKGKPVIISTGIATLSDIEQAIAACKRMKNDQIALLKCTSVYPAPLDMVNLRAIPRLADAFGTIVGLSDHTLSVSVPAGAVALGAQIIEKHFILRRELGGPDASFSLEPGEFKAMVAAVRDVESALGDGSLELTKEAGKSRLTCRSLFVVQDIRAGDLLTEDNVRSIRPGHGLAPKYLNDVLGKKATKYLKKGTPLTFDMME